VGFDVDRVTDNAWAAMRAVDNAATEGAAKARIRALINAIITEIKDNATIESLTVTNTPADGPGHNHAPAQTNEATGKIK
jgi:hypothetical protein